MLKKLSCLCGGDLNGKDVARDCAAAAGAIFAVFSWALAVVL